MSPVSYLLTFDAMDNNIVFTLLAFDHLALHLLQSVCQRGLGKSPYFDRRTINVFCG